MSMKLTALLVGSTPVTDIGNEYDEILNVAGQHGSSEPLRLEETVSEGYQDISSITNFNKYWEDICIDYRCFRARLIEHVTQAGGFNNLSQQEKTIVAKEFCASKEDRDTVFTVEEQVQNGKRFHSMSVEARKKRRVSAEALVYNRINAPVEQVDLINDVAQLLNIYVEFGIEGTETGDPEGILDYVDGTAGTVFENGGFPQKSYTIEGMTSAEFGEKIKTILKDGPY